MKRAGLLGVKPAPLTVTLISYGTRLKLTYYDR
jgi:hypothetical protein